MFVIILRNIVFFVICNDIRTRIFKIIKNVLKTKIIAENYVNKKVIISRIFLNLKNNEINKNRKKLMFVFFTRLQFFIQFAFVIIINKFQNQLLCYVNINIKIRECFSYNQLYVAIFKITKKCNLYIITLKNNFVNEIKKIRNVI